MMMVVAVVGVTTTLADPTFNKFASLKYSKFQQPYALRSPYYVVPQRRLYVLEGLEGAPYGLPGLYNQGFGGF